MPMFFIDEKFQVQGTTIISGEDARHIIKVLRYKPGDVLRISDGVHAEGSAIIEGIDHRNLIIKVRGLEKNNIVDIKPKITLLQGLPKGDKMDFILQKNTEIGVSEFLPVYTERTIVELCDDRMRRRGHRWGKILREAAKQCGRPDIPKVNPPVRFDRALENICDYDLAIIPWEREKAMDLRQLIKSADENVSKAAVFIGPEGGFCEEEIEKAVKAGFLPVSLGPRIMRTETAGVVINSVLMYELGDLGGSVCQR